MGIRNGPIRRRFPGRAATGRPGCINRPAEAPSSTVAAVDLTGAWRAGHRAVMAPCAHSVTAATRSRYLRGFWSPTRGVRLPADRHDLVARCEALRLALPELIAFSGETSVQLWEGVSGSGECLEVTIAVGAHPVRRAGVRARRRELLAGDVIDVHGLPVTSPQRTFVDIAERVSVPLLVAVGDDFLRRRLCTRMDIAAVMARSAGQRGVRAAKRAAELLDARAESPRESLTRALIVEAGLPAPTPQIEIHDSHGRFIARGDLVYEDLRIVIEYDGYHHLTLEGQRRDARRRGELGLEHWLIVTIVPADIRRPQQLIEKVRRALSARGAPLTEDPK